MSGRSRCLAIAVAVTVVGVTAATATADPAPPQAPTSSQISSQVLWRSGQSPVVTSDRGSTPTLPSKPASPNDYSACNVTTGYPDKYSSSLVSVDSYVVCTPDVHYLWIGQQLWRGLGPTYEIGVNSNSEDSDAIDVTTLGACASSTWAYYGYVPEVEACSTVNGCVYWTPTPPEGPYKYITC